MPEVSNPYCMMIHEKKLLQYWLMKSEPDEVSIDDLQRLERHHWDGVRGYQARNFMRDDMREGDMVIFYHSSVTPAGPAGIARVACLAYPDFTQWDKKHKYYDPKASKEKPIWYMVDVMFVKKFSELVPRATLAAAPSLKNSMLWTHNRLSIIPLSKKEYDTIVRLGEKS